MNGKSVKVLNAFCTGSRKVSKLRINVFYEDTYVTPDHNFWVGDLNSISEKTLSKTGYRKHLDKQSKTSPKQSKYKWKQISNLQQDVLLMPKTLILCYQKHSRSFSTRGQLVIGERDTTMKVIRLSRRPMSRDICLALSSVMVMPCVLNTMVHI